MEEFGPLKEKLRVVIFCGGYGTRMWPMSRQSLPKQFQPLLGDKSFFQKSVSRIRKEFKPEDIFFSTPEEQVKFVRDQAGDIPLQNIIAEPERRDTLGAVGFSTAFINKKFPNSLMAVVWGADHIVREEKRFRRLLKIGGQVCQKKNVICKIDVEPTYPSTALGWVKIGKVLGKVGGYKVYNFEKFIEKPDLVSAGKMFGDKNYLFNTGYFVWRTSTMLGFLEKYAPKTFNLIDRISDLIGESKNKKQIARLYHQIEKTSVDFGLFEKLPAGSQVVIPADLGWYDTGTWDLFYEALAVGQRQNITRGEVEFIEAKGNLVYLPKGKIGAVIGVENLVIVDTPDGLLVCRRGKSAQIKKFIEVLKLKGKEKYL